jgi:hypothetical protein
MKPVKKGKIRYTRPLPPPTAEETCGTPRNKMEAAHRYVEEELAVEWERLTREMRYYGALSQRMVRFIKKEIEDE